MEKDELNKAIAYLADKVSKYHERLLAAERDLERHINSAENHRCENCQCED